jgi:hypothetical protein
MMNERKNEAATNGSTKENLTQRRKDAKNFFFASLRLCVRLPLRRFSLPFVLKSFFQ